MDYNTQRQQILLKEYGRNIQVMVENLLQVEDKDNRTKQASQLVELMRQFVQPGSRDNNDVTHKIWDDVFIISNFKLEVEAPFEKPDSSVINKKPEPLGYRYSQPKLKHYGKNIEYLVAKIATIEEETEKENAIIFVARLMKSFFAQYNKEVVEDEVIKEQLYRISGGKIKLDLEKVKAENLLDLNTNIRLDNRSENQIQSRHKNNNGRSNNQGRNNNSNNNNNQGRNNNDRNNPRSNNNNNNNKNRRRK